MTDQERNAAFQTDLENALAALSKRYGFTIAAELQSEQLGAVWQVRPVLVMKPLPNWQPPADPPALNGNGSNAAGERSSAEAEDSKSDSIVKEKK